MKRVIEVNENVSFIGTIYKKGLITNIIRFNTFQIVEIVYGKVGEKILAKNDKVYIYTKDGWLLEETLKRKLETLSHV